MLDFISLSTGFPNMVVSRDINLKIYDGELISLIGPNGCGKTTLLRTIAGITAPKSGAVLLNGVSVHKMPIKKRAHVIAYLPQIRDSLDISVENLVCHGRYPYAGFSRKMSADDEKMVNEAIRLTGLSGIRKKSLSTISGGQRQKAYIAMTIAQNTPTMLWDEPTTFLDISNKFEILKLAGQINNRGTTIIMTVHDLSDALMISHRICVMDITGKICAFDTPRNVVESGVISSVFGVKTGVAEQAAEKPVYYFMPNM